MTKFKFTFDVPEEISSNKDWFLYLSESFRDLSTAYKESAENSPDELPKTHPFYVTLLDEARGRTTLNISESGINPDIPLLLKCVPFTSLDPIEGDGDVVIITMENMRLALENCLQDHAYAHTVCIEGSNFIIEPMLDNTLPVTGAE